MKDLDRRLILLGLVCSICVAYPLPASAKDGDGGGGNSGSGGSGNSGSGSGGSDDGGDDDNEDDDDNSGLSGEHDRARNAVNNGRAVPLATLRSYLSANFPGKVVKISLEKSGGELVYRVRILQVGNRLMSLTLDAQTLKRKWL